jgi:hypothetical protein
VVRSRAPGRQPSSAPRPASLEGSRAAEVTNSEANAPQQQSAKTHSTVETEAPAGRRTWPHLNMVVLKGSQPLGSPTKGALPGAARHQPRT